MAQTTPGGRYVVAGALVDAEGRPIAPQAADAPPTDPPAPSVPRRRRRTQEEGDDGA